ncbi:S-methyl-5-thioribose-1-phosphate isomerase [Leptospira alstonii]|uniref:Methylthioribose-1-phosphate isomerase n=2 Tax=Leptospira alstonii TaxID=28452 RepID=M6D1B1_9LEPT|nr:S-methyl-5-thioribose-1-phosphate isomerase [Leptospira alstonii]EMJ92380.1 S-methyl-5-thioribose-1-phosphate isomerase [Leptospira alstonii serovar Sichuan str. 79601]EQA79587.1 S-methyl-5-thioribose-1-phosphate isomerase [Leptospira alstonii serovar Pingchang str. 80-412]
MRESVLKPILWTNKELILLDQRVLPGTTSYLTAKTMEDCIFAIREMVVRGAPAIAITGAFGIVLYLNGLSSKPTLSELKIKLDELLESRPTAVNLRLAIEEFSSRFPKSDYSSFSLQQMQKGAEEFALFMLEEDLGNNLTLSKNALSLFPKSPSSLNIITHCNTGALATAGHGTALGVIRSLRDAGHSLTVFADETRPYLQGARLTAWELKEEGIPSYLITDNMAGWVMASRKIHAVIVGADRIASNGDTANKIGTYPLAIVAKHHGVPFYVAATAKSMDFRIPDGSHIPIEMRKEEEVTSFGFLKDAEGKPLLNEGVIAPNGMKALNPSFDVTPASLITGIITERGIVSPVNEENLKKVFG